MYSPKNLLQKNPIQISGALFAIANATIVSGWVEMTVEQLAAWETALLLVLGLFVASQTVNKAVLSELADSPPTVDGTPVVTGEAMPAKRKQRGAVDLKDILVLALIVLVVVLIIAFWPA